METLKRFCRILHRTNFTLQTDHKVLEHFMKQEHFSLRQHQWIDVLNEFNYNIQYIPGKDNKFTDSLSRIYSDEPNGVVCVESELVDKGDDTPSNVTLRMKPVYVEVYLLDLMRAEMVQRLSKIADKPSPRYKETKDQVLRLRNREPETLVAVESGNIRPHHLEEAQCQEIGLVAFMFFFELLFFMFLRNFFLCFPC